MNDAERLAISRRCHGKTLCDEDCAGCFLLAQLDAVTAERNALRREVEAYRNTVDAIDEYAGDDRTGYLQRQVVKEIRKRVATLTQPPAPTGAITKEPSE